MSKVLSLKELRTSSTLKAEMKKLEDDKSQLQDQFERQKKLEKKLRDDILHHKKDFEHLEKQFNYFANLETEHDSLQQAIQMERLEKLIDGDKKDNTVNAQTKKVKEELSVVQAELKELKKLDPQRLKRQVTDLKKKSLDQVKDNKNINTALISERKEVKELSAAKETLEQDLEAANNQTNFFWESKDSIWTLYESALVLKDEKKESPDEDAPNRIQCLNQETGVSVVSLSLDKDDKAVWVGDIEIPEDVSIEAGKRLMKIATEAEEDDD